MSTEAEPLFLVWQKNGLAPTHEHDTSVGAFREAERLAKQNPGETFIVLEAIKSCTITDPVQWVTYNQEVPF